MIAALAWTIVLPLVVGSAAAAPRQPPPGEWHRQLDGVGIDLTTFGDRTVVATTKGFVALDAAGATQWEVPISGLTIQALSAGDDGVTFATGLSSSAGVIGTTPVSTNGPRPFVARLSSSGTVEWARELEASVNVSDIVAVPDGSGFATFGRRHRDPFDYGSIDRYAADGSHMWRVLTTLGTSTVERSPRDLRLAAGPDGAILLMTEIDRAITLGSAPHAITTVAPNSDFMDNEVMVATIERDGRPAWARVIGSNDIVMDGGGFDIDCAGNVTVSVSTSPPLRGAPGTISVDREPVSPPVGGDVVVRLGPNGELAWAHEIEGGFEPLTLSTGCDGTTHVAGRAWGDLTYGPVGNRVVTREGGSYFSPASPLARIGINADGSPAYAVVETTVQSGRPQLASVGGGGVRILSVGTFAFSFGYEAGPPTGSHSAVGAFGPIPSAAADPLHAGPALAWHRVDGEAAGTVGYLTQTHGRMAIAGDVDRSERLETREGPFRIVDDGPFVARLDGRGAMLWARQLTAVNEQMPRIAHAAVDPRGGVFVTGSFGRRVQFRGPGGTIARSYTHPPGTHPSTRAGFVARYAPDGGLAWIRVLTEATLGRQAMAIGQRVVPMPDGGVIVSTSSRGHVRYGTGPHDRVVQRVYGDVSGLLLVRYDAYGRVLWRRSTATGDPWGINADARGRTHEIGTLFEPIVAGGRVVRPSALGEGVFVASRGVDGRRQAVRALVVPREHTELDLLLQDTSRDQAGRSYVLISYSARHQIDPAAGGPIIDTSDELGTPSDQALIALRPDGRLQWVLRLRPGHQQLHDLETHPDGGVVASGTVSGRVVIGDREIEVGSDDQLLLRVRPNRTFSVLVDGNAGNEILSSFVVLPSGRIVGTTTSTQAHFGANTSSEFEIDELERHRLMLLGYRDPMH
jgi:hypothetical protein